MSHCGPCPSSSESPVCSSGEICQPYVPGLGPRTTSWLSGDLFSFQGAFCFSRLSTECGSGSQVAQRKHAAAVHLESDVVLRANWRNVDIVFCLSGMKPCLYLIYLFRTWVLGCSTCSKNIALAGQALAVLQ